MYLGNLINNFYAIFCPGSFEKLSNSEDIGVIPVAYEKMCLGWNKTQDWADQCICEIQVSFSSYQNFSIKTKLNKLQVLFLRLYKVFWQ